MSAPTIHSYADNCGGNPGGVKWHTQGASLAHIYPNRSVVEFARDGAWLSQSAQTFASIADWKAELARRGWSTLVRSSETSFPVFRFDGEIAEADLQNKNILHNHNKTSKVVLTKDGLLELRRRDITWKRNVMINRHMWPSVAAWKTWLVENCMDPEVETEDGYRIIPTAPPTVAPPPPMLESADTLGCACCCPDVANVYAVVDISRAMAAGKLYAAIEILSNHVEKVIAARSAAAN